MNLTYEEMLEQAGQLIEDRQDFTVYGLSGKMGEAVDYLEKVIEGKQLSCRIYTVGRSASIAAGLLSGPVGVFSALAIAGHNLATYNPDYEIGKRLVDHKLEVTFKKRS